MTDPNQKYLIYTFRRKTTEGAKQTVYVYLLDPRSKFEGFGGSSSGLLVGKTASVVVRDAGPWGWQDTEYGLNDKFVWSYVARLIAEGSLAAQ